MTRDEIKRLLLEVLATLAPEADLQSLKPTVSLREELDLDSFDLLRFLGAIDEKFGVEIPEEDSAKLDTLDGCINYLSTKLLPSANNAPARAAGDTKAHA